MWDLSSRGACSLQAAALPVSERSVLKLVRVAWSRIAVAADSIMSTQSNHCWIRIIDVSVKSKSIVSEVSSRCSWAPDIQVYWQSLPEAMSMYKVTTLPMLKAKGCSSADQLNGSLPWQLHKDKHLKMIWTKQHSFNRIHKRCCQRIASKQRTDPAACMTTGFLVVPIALDRLKNNW